MTKSDTFDKAWQEKCRKAQELGIAMKRTLDSIESFGGVETARRVFARRRNSDGFGALAKIGRLDLSLEALVQEPASAACSPTRRPTLPWKVSWTQAITNWDKQEGQSRRALPSLCPCRGPRLPHRPHIPLPLP